MMTIENFKDGIRGGLLGGLIFGLMMGMMGTLPEIGSLVGVPNTLVGFTVHMLMSAGIGSGFGVLCGSAVRALPSGVILGVGFGVFWWLLGPLTMMPLVMGKGFGVNWNLDGASVGKGFGVNWNLDGASALFPSLIGHVVFGVVLGASFAHTRPGTAA